LDKNNDSKIDKPIIITIAGEISEFFLKTSEAFTWISVPKVYSSNGMVVFRIESAYYTRVPEFGEVNRITQSFISLYVPRGTVINYFKVEISDE
jgi:hypothetical protein